MATKCVQAACVLHNFLMRDSNPLVLAMENKAEQALKKAWDLNVSGLKGIPKMRGFHSGMELWAVRNIFTTYFCSKEGHIPWQDQYACADDLEDDAAWTQRRL